MLGDLRFRYYQFYHDIIANKWFLCPIVAVQLTKMQPLAATVFEKNRTQRVPLGLQSVTTLSDALRQYA